MEIQTQLMIHRPIFAFCYCAEIYAEFFLFEPIWGIKNIYIAPSCKYFAHKPPEAFQTKISVRILNFQKPLPRFLVFVFNLIVPVDLGRNQGLAHSPFQNHQGKLGVQLKAFKGSLRLLLVSSGTTSGSHCQFNGLWKHGFYADNSNASCREVGS